VAGQDGGWSIRSVGGQRGAGVEWMAVGGEGTDRRIGLWSPNGTEVLIDGNPLPTPCEPCTLSAHLSDDGTLLAYSSWPVAFWQVEMGGGYDEVWDRWRAEVSDVPVGLGVVNLDTRALLWSGSADAWSRVSDFDGRWLVVESGGHSVIYDTLQDEQPVPVNGEAALMRRP